MKWNDEDIYAVEEAVELGIIKVPKDTIIEPLEWENHDPFHPISVPATLTNWQSTRLGDVEIKFVIPYRWSTNVSEIATAMRKRLIIHIMEFDPDAV